MEESKRNDKRTGHQQGTPRPPGYLYPSEREERYSHLVARLDRAAAAMNMTRAAFLRRYGSASRPTRRNGKARSLDC